MSRELGFREEVALRIFIAIAERGDGELEQVIEKSFSLAQAFANACCKKHGHMSTGSGCTRCGMEPKREVGEHGENCHCINCERARRRREFR